MDEQKGILMKIDKTSKAKTEIKEIIEDIIMNDLAERYNKLSMKDN